MVVIINTSEFKYKNLIKQKNKTIKKLKQKNNKLIQKWENSEFYIEDYISQIVKYENDKFNSEIKFIKLEKQVLEMIEKVKNNEYKNLELQKDNMIKTSKINNYKKYIAILEDEVNILNKRIKKLETK